MKTNKILKFIGNYLLFTFLCISSIFAAETHNSWNGDENTPYEIVNNNIPYFTEKQKKNTTYFIELEDLDSLGRTGVTFMNIEKDKLPKTTREPISTVQPTGWKYNGKSNNNKYKGVVSGSYIYNRCHQLGYQFSGLNAEKKNLFTGTRFININGQLPFEDDVTSYVKNTGNHCLYRCTPIFLDDNLICEGVRLEGWSVEDNGEGICFNVFCYNVQPNITIDYATGQNWLTTEAPEQYKTTYKENLTETNSVNPQNNNSSNEDSISDVELNNNETYIEDYENNLEEYEDEENEEETTNKKTKVKSSASSGGETATYGLVLIFIIFIWLFKSDGGGSSGSSGGYSSRGYSNSPF